jgi:hypothetical protein
MLPRAIRLQISARLRCPLERVAVMMAHPFRAPARAILALVALVPGALEGRMWVGIGLVP